MKKYNETSYKISELITKEYSTSFYSASVLFDKEIRKDIFNIYGFVRFADEIVDTFHNYDKAKLLKKFGLDYLEAYQSRISLNPILHSFQKTVRKYNIPQDYIAAFLKSMKDDLNKTNYSNKQEINDYIYGSADVVGLMCLKVFCNGNEVLFNELKFSAVKLGSAFQKVNFLRDLKDDMQNLGRYYFPEIQNNSFDENVKKIIVQDIESDFKIALTGIRKLPKNSKLAVYTAFVYYSGLLQKIKNTDAKKIINQRIRISNFTKFWLILNAIVRNKLNLYKFY